MTRIAIFTEGQSESIFVRDLVQKLIDNTKLSFECMKLRAERLIAHPFSYSYSSPDAQVHFLIIDVGNDCKVLGAIKDRERGLLNRGYHKIIGLRDMYSEEYKKRSTVINDQVSQDFLIGAQKTINQMSRPDVIVLYFAIMEFEAWLLSMYGLFPKIHPSLTLENIQNQRGYNVRDIDPQEEFYRPAKELNEILKLAGLGYQKSSDEVEMICSRIAVSDYGNAIENHRCMALKAFLSDVSRYQ